MTSACFAVSCIGKKSQRCWWFIFC